MQARRPGRPSALSAILAVVGLAVVGLAACGRTAPLDPGTTGPPGGPLPSGEVTPTTQGRAGATSPPVGSRPRQEAATSTTGPSGGSGASGAGAKGADAAVARAAAGSVGGFARTLLGPGAAASIVVELLAQPGAAVTEATIARVTALLGQLSGKPVTTRRVELEDATARAWTAEDLYALADARGLPQTASPAVLRLALVHGSFAGEDSALGVAVRGDLAAILVDRIGRTGSLLVPSSQVEEAVVVHEVGHLLGLVDLALDTGREDPGHPGHSPSRESVMYWAIESDLVLDLLAGGPPTEFDAADLADLEALRAGR